MSTGYTITEEERQRRSARMKALNSGEKLPTREEIETIALRRFSLGDLEGMGAWLLGRLREAYPHLDERNFPGWLRGCMEGREYVFLRTDGACGLAMIRHAPLGPIPDVHVLFVLLKDGDRLEAAAIYAEIYRWAAMQRANRLWIEGIADVDKDFIAHCLGRYKVEKTAYVAVD